MPTLTTLFGETAYQSAEPKLVRRYAEGIRHYSDLVDTIIDGEVNNGEDRNAVIMWIAKHGPVLNRRFQEFKEAFPVK